jgi:hypothetical protein
MAIAYVAVGSSSAVASGDMTPGLPAGIAADDILISACAQRDDVAPTMTGDWTPIYDVNVSAGRRAAAWWHRYDGSTSPDTTITRAAGDSGSARITAFSGCITTGSPIDTFDTFAHTVNATTCTYPSVVPSAANYELVFIHHAMNNGAVGQIDGANPVPTERWDFQNAGGLDTGLSLAHGPRTTADASGARSATELAAGHHVQGVIVLKLPGGTDTPQAVAASGTGTPALTAAVGLSVALPVTGTGTPALTRQVARNVALAITGAGTAAMSRLGAYGRTLAVAGTGAVALLESFGTAVAMAVAGTGAVVLGAVYEAGGGIVSWWLTRRRRR